MATVPGRQVGRYRLIEFIGAGGMGEVFLAHDPQLDRRVALKLLPSHLAEHTLARERLRREALSAAALDHPFICKVFEVGEDEGSIFIAMEYVRGETLAARISSGPLPLAEVLRITSEIAEAIEEAHSANLVHRDLKPANIMLTSQGRVKIMDFGLAKKVEVQGPGGETLSIENAQLTATGAVVGTPDYMSPEQLSGAPLDGRSDLFALGIIFCEMLIGRHPFRRGSAIETMAAILRDPPNLSASGSGALSPGLMVLVRRLLAKSPAERYPSAAAVRTDLAAQKPPGVSAAPEAREHCAVTLIGRDGERDQLLRHMDAAMAGRGSMVLIGGEPGIGKTHLTREIVAEAERRGCFAVVGHCYEMEGAPPYVPFIEMLEYCARVTPRESFRYSIGEGAPEIAKLMPELRRLYSDIPTPVVLPPEQQRRYLFNAYREFVERAARLIPIVAVFEDLHWAEEATLLLLRHLAQSLSIVPVLIIGTYRDEDRDVAWPLTKALESWVREKLATRIVLRRFGWGGVQDLLTLLGSKQPPESLSRAVYEETEGNPFFVGEVFQHLREEGQLFDEAGNWRTRLPADEIKVPQGVRIVVGRRLERLCEQTRRMLTMGAVVGRSFDLKLIEALESSLQDSVLDAIEEAERAQLIESDRRGRDLRYRFVHELVRQTLAEALSLPRRQRLHARIADALERTGTGAHVSAVAHHLYQAGALADLHKTVDYLTRAAALASASAAHEEVLATVDRALSLVEGDGHPRISELSLWRAIGLRSLGRTEEAVEWYERAVSGFIADGNLAPAVEASLNLVGIQLWRFEGPRAVAVLNRLLQIIGTDPSPLLHRLLLLKAVSLALGGSMDASRAALLEAKKVEAVLPQPPSDGLPLKMEADLMYCWGQMDEADKLGRTAISRFRAVGDLWGEADVFEPVAGCGSLGRVQEAAALIGEALPRAERVGHVAGARMYKSCAAVLLVAVGDLDGAARATRETHNFAEQNSLAWIFLEWYIRGSIAFYRGQLDEALQYFRQGRKIEPATFQLGMLAGALFRVLAAKGDSEAEAALADARRFLPVPGRQLSYGSCECLALVLEGLAISGRLEEAAALRSEAEDVVANGAMCLTSLYLFRVAAGIAAAAARDWEQAEQHFGIAIQQADSAPYRTAQPIARLRYAEMLIAREGPQDLASAQELLREALRLFESVGMTWYAQQTAARIAAFGPNA